MKNLPRSLILVAFLTLVYVLALAINLMPWLRGPAEWRWAQPLPGTLERLWLPALVLISYTLLAHWLHQHQFSLTRRLKIFAIALAALMTPALQLALLYMELGIYWLVNGERLVLTQPGGDMITVGSIEIH